jgi:hypothetical protein
MMCSPEIESTLYFGRLRDAGLCFCRRWRRGHKGESGRRWGGRRLAEAGVRVNAAEKFGVEAGDAIGGHELEEFTDDMVDIGDGGEFVEGEEEGKSTAETAELRSGRRGAQRFRGEEEGRKNRADR